MKIIDQYRFAPPVWPQPNALINFNAGTAEIITGQTATSDVVPTRVTSPAKFGSHSIRINAYAEDLYYASTIVGGSFPSPTATGDWTFGGWYYPTAAGVDEVLFGLSNTAGWNTATFRFSTLNNRFEFSYLVGTPGSIATVGLGPLNQFTLNTWHYLEASRVGSNIYLFKNGLLIGTATGVGTMGINGSRGGYFLVGAGAGGGSIGGTYYIDEVALWSTQGLHTSSFQPRTTPFVI